MQSCGRCRDRHAKCDKIKPKCGRCLRDKQACAWLEVSKVPEGTRSTFHTDQVWLPVPPNVDFVFENLNNSYTYQESSSSSGIPTSKRTASGEAARAPNGSSPHNVLPSETCQPLASETLSEVNSSSSFQNANKAICNFRCSYDDIEPTRSVGKPFLKSGQEAILFRHFVSHLVDFLDIADSQHHFAVEVPQRARYNPILLNAILALSARYLHRTANYDAYISDKYSQECLRTLISIFDDSEAVMDDAVFAAVIILRFLEELEVPFTGSDPQGHRLGTRAIISMLQSASPSSIGSLRKSCYWTAYRQEFYISLVSQRPMEWDLPESMRIIHPQNDDEWALLAVQHCGKVLEYCLADNMIRGKRAFTDLMQELTFWQEQRPTTFDATYVTPSVGETCSLTFPRIFFHAENHVMGHQYHTIAKALLVAHSPISNFGSRRRLEMQRIDDSIRADVSRLCGIAKANSHVPCAALVACMSIAVFGDRFRTNEERAVLQDMLVETERLHAWPTTQFKGPLEMH